MKLSKAVGWKPGDTPTPADGFEVKAFAQGLNHPRWLYELPNGDILVAETDAPQASSGRGGVLSWFAKRVMRFTGSGYPSADRITLLRDTDEDGVADLQAPFMSLLATAEGTSVITEAIFENRLQHVAELQRMGAAIRTQGNTAFIEGVPFLSGAQVTGSDLRASAAMVLAGLAAEGTTLVQGLQHLDRGYDRLEEKLRSVGASIERHDVG